MKKRRALIIVTLICALIMTAVGLAAMSVPANSEPKEKDAHHYIGRGDIYYQDGEYEMALASYQKALEVDAQSIAALHGQALCNSALGYTEDAIADYEKLAAVAPDDADIQLERVNAMIVAGDLEKAKATLEGLLTTFDNEKMDQLYQQMTVAAPQADLQSGTYDSYQLLNMTSENTNAAIYYTTDGTEPHSGSKVYTEHLVISAPSTVLKAKCINYLGYESDVIELDYTITVPVEQIMNRDYSSFGYAVKQVLNRGYNQPIYNYEVAQITSLYIVGDGYYSNLDSTTFYRNSFNPGNYASSYSDRGDGDLSKLKYLPFLETLVVCWQNNVSLQAVSELQYLKNLSLLNNNISDISPLSKLTGLEKLALGWNNIQDISALKGMENLISLGLWNNQIKDISAVSQLTKLQYLDIANNQVTSLDAVSQLHDLQEFWANGNQITTLSPVDPDGVLRILMISDNPLEDYQTWKDTHPHLVRTDILD